MDNNPFLLHEQLEYIEEQILTGMLGMSGGIANYVYLCFKRDRPIKIYGFFINAALAFFIGNVFGSFISSEYVYRDGVLMLAGFSTFPILGILEELLPSFFKMILKNKLNIKDNKDDPLE